MKSLDRSLGLGAVISISISSMLGSGIFVLPGLAFAQTGASAWMAYLAAGICVLPAALSKSELATAMPTSGGTYVYLERTFGPLFGMIAGLGLWLSLLLKSAFALFGIGAYVAVLTNVSSILGMPISKLLPISLLILIVFLNILGVGKVSKSLIVVVILSVITLGILSFYGTINYDPELLNPYYSNGLSGFFVATGMVFVSYAGVTKVAAIAEEIKEPEKNLPRGILLSLLVVTIIYCVVTFVLSANLSQAVLHSNYRSIHTLAELFWGTKIGWCVAVVAIITMMSMANAGVMAASRFPFAMSRDSLLPKFLGTLSPKYLTPVWSILISGGIVGYAILFFNVQEIAKLASSFILLIYMFENIAVIVLRETRVQWYKPRYKSPFYPWVQMFGILSLILLLTSMKSVVVSGIVGISIPGFLIYIFYARKRTKRKGVVGIHGARKDLTAEFEQESGSQKRVEKLRFVRHAKSVVPLFGKERTPEVLIEMAAALSTGELIEVTHLTEVPEQVSLSDIHDDSAHVRSLRRRINALSVKQNAPVAFDAVVSHDIFKSIYDISYRLHCEWLVTEWGGKTRGALTLHNPVGWLRNHLSCHLAIFRDAGVRYIRKVLVISKSDEHDRLIISTADQIARAHEARLTIVKVVNDAIDQREEDALLMLLQALGKSYCQSPTTTQIIKGEDTIAAIVAATVEYDLLIFGDTDKQTFWMHLFGSEADRLIEKATCSVVSVRPCPYESRNFEPSNDTKKNEKKTQ